MESAEAHHFSAGRVSCFLYCLWPSLLAVGLPLSTAWKEVPLALTGVTRICLNTIFVNCDPDPAPSRGAAEWRKEEESRRQFWMPVPLPPELFPLPGQAV